VLFLTGASGYIGLRVGERLRAQGETVRALVLPGDPVDPSRRFPCEVVRGDVSRLETFAESGAGVTAIVHAAAVMPPGTPEQMRDVNVQGTANMIAFARRWGVRRFVYF